MDFYLFFIFVSWIVTRHVKGRNRELYFPGYYFFANRRLKNHVIKTEHVIDLDQCEFLCYQHDDCVSFNFKKYIDSATGQHACELNNSTHMEHDEDMGYYDDFFHRGAKNACRRNLSCFNNGSCQSGFTDKGYRCLCSPGFGGDHCEKEKWKKINDAPVCFGAQNDKYGTFKMRESGLIFTFKLVHKSGSLSCNQKHPSSYWGCDNPNHGDKRLATVITYPNKTALLLADYLKHNPVGFCGFRYYSYQIAGMGVNSPELVFNNLPAPLLVSAGQEFQIWYAQDLRDCTESNNKGQTCAEVYAWYA